MYTITLHKDRESTIEYVIKFNTFSLCTLWSQISKFRQKASMISYIQFISNYCLLWTFWKRHSKIWLILTLWPNWPCPRVRPSDTGSINFKILVEGFMNNNLFIQYIANKYRDWEKKYFHYMAIFALLLDLNPGVLNFTILLEGFMHSVYL